MVLREISTRKTGNPAQAVICQTVNTTSNTQKLVGKVGKVLEKGELQWYVEKRELETLETQPLEME